MKLGNRYSVTGKIVIGLVMILLAFDVTAQRKDSLSNELKIVARSSMDSIVLRWAPMQVSSWLEGNKFGYMIERFVLVRDKKILALPERKVMTNVPIKPLPLNSWEPLVKKDKYAAIAAQAIYGSAFELTTQGTDVFQIVNKVKENEQRFSFALFSADMSPMVSIAMGLRFTDRSVKKGEKYLYRVRCIPTQAGYDTLKGSIFLEAEIQELPKPLDFTAEFNGPMVSMKWNQSYYKGVYTAFVVERSADGKVFKSISEDPLVTLGEEDKEESRYQYATDSLPDHNNEYQYRVRGLTPFGELGPPSDVVKGKGSVSVLDVPHITLGESRNNQSIIIEWEFPPTAGDGLKGFQVQRAEEPKAKFQPINPTLLPIQARSYEDLAPKQTNYYQVVGVALNGEEFRSPVYYTQLIDSIPPLAPIGMKGEVDENGAATFSWTPNAEADIYGYRIYRGNFLNEEFSQITIEPIRSASFLDSVNLKTLNRQIHYQIMAIDRNQNHSGLSQVLTLELPDKVKPAPPYFLPVKSSREGVVLQWGPSGSDDVSHYDVYRKDRTAQTWTKIASVAQNADSLYIYKDNSSEEARTQSYTVVAVDRAGLESDPAQAVSGTKLLTAVKPAITMSDPDIDRTNKKIVLKWKYDQRGVEKYQVYRAKEGENLKLYSTIAGTAFNFEDRQLITNSTYTYRVMALFVTGAKSELSREIKVVY